MNFVSASRLSDCSDCLFLDSKRALFMALDFNVSIPVPLAFVIGQAGLVWDDITR
jgi:hypothetical protein